MTDNEIREKMMLRKMRMCKSDGRYDTVRYGKHTFIPDITEDGDIEGYTVLYKNTIDLGEAVDIREAITMIGDYCKAQSKIRMEM